MVRKKGISIQVEEEKSWEQNSCLVFDQKIRILSTRGALLKDRAHQQMFARPEFLFMFVS